MSRESPYHTAPASLPPHSRPDGVRVSYPLNTSISYPQIQDSPQTVHRPDLFFANNSHLQSVQRNRAISQPSYNSTLSSFPIHQLYPAHQQAFYQYSPPTAPPPRDVYANYPPPLPPPPAPTHQYNAAPASNIPLPPILPPKPIVYPDVGAVPRVHSYPSKPSISIPQAPPLPPPTEEELITSPDTEDSNELAMALALSQSESIAQQKLEEDLRNQEEEDLARALAESLLSTGSAIDSTRDPFFTRAECKVPSISNSTGDTPRRTESPTPVHVNQQLTGAASTSHSTIFTDHNYPEFGLHEKWRIPGFQDNETATTTNPHEDRPEEPLRQIASHEPSYVASGALAVPERIPRPPSIASVSSLAYMRDPPDEEEPEGSNVSFSHNSTDTTGNDNVGEPDSSPHTSPEIASTESHSSTSWTSGQLVDVYAASDEPNILAFDDEAYARQLAAEEEALAVQEQYPNEKAQALPLYSNERQSSLPMYTPNDEHNQFVTSPISDEQLFAPLAPDFISPSYSAPNGVTPTRDYASPRFQYTQPSINRGQSGSDLGSDFRLNHSSNPGTIHHYSSVTYPLLENSHEPDHDARSDSSHHSLSRTATTSSIPRNGSYTASSTSPHTERQPSGSAPSITAAGVLNANHFIDRQLLLGVSIGFKTPTISTTLVPMEDPMPNIISLPYARCPPLHLHAPDWRHLLRLMARLSGTRIEPTVEAMAVSKTELKLRTVVQFIKPRSTSSEWRTILWFTIDHPIPPSLPGAARYATPNPNLLPWSYTLSPIPMLLRDATDTNISKTYTIPPSESVPLPNLPITFPNLALYLQAALDESRRHSNDSSTGLGKLGKIMQMCYPAVEQTYSEFDIPERTRMTDMFKRVMKRGNKDKKKGKTTNNEETYQLVTPFVPDEWG